MEPTRNGTYTYNIKIQSLRYKLPRAHLKTVFCENFDFRSRQKICVTVFYLPFGLKYFTFYTLYSITAESK